MAICRQPLAACIVVASIGCGSDPSPAAPAPGTMATGGQSGGAGTAGRGGAGAVAGGSGGTAGSSGASGAGVGGAGQAGSAQGGTAGVLIGTEGGVVSFTGGSLTVPAGALSTPVAVSATVGAAPGGFQSVGVDVHFAPPGLSFAKPAHLALSFASSAHPVVFAGAPASVGYQWLVTTVEGGQALADISQLTSKGCSYFPFSGTTLATVAADVKTYPLRRCGAIRTTASPRRCFLSRRSALPSEPSPRRPPACRSLRGERPSPEACACRRRAP